MAIQKYRNLLDTDEEGHEVANRASEIHAEGIGKHLLDEEHRPDEAQQRQLLQDFYKQMNEDAEAEFAKELDRRQAARREAARSEAAEGEDSQQLSEQDEIIQRRH